MKWWDLQTNKLKHCSTENVDEYNNKFGKVWSPGSELMLGTNIYTLKTSKIDPSYHPFIKYDIFEVNVNLTPRGNPIGIVSQYC